MALNATVAYSVCMTPVDYEHQTTVITGASSGIGAAFARELARRGSDVVLVARRRDRLDALAVELREAHRITATVIPLDLSAPAAGRALAAQVAERGLSVTSLINNAGFATDGPCHDEDAARLTDENNVDVANLVDITRAFIGPLRVASTGLRVLSFAPGLTRTEFFDVLGSAGYKGRYQTPEQVVAAALHTLDRGDRQPSVTSGRMSSLSTPPHGCSAAGAPCSSPPPSPHPRPGLQLIVRPHGRAPPIAERGRDTADGMGTPSTRRPCSTGAIKPQTAI